MGRGQRFKGLPGNLSWPRGALTTSQGARPASRVPVEFGLPPPEPCEAWLSLQSGLTGAASQGPPCKGTPGGARGLALRRLTLGQTRAGVQACHGEPSGNIQGKGGPSCVGLAESSAAVLGRIRRAETDTSAGV